MANKACLKCTKLRDEDRYFYKKRNGERSDYCKDCLTMHIKNYEPETFVWVLKELDFPYIPEEWITLRDKAYAKDKNNVGGSVVLGKYLAKMRMKQFNKYGWEDSEKLQLEREEKRKAAIAAREQNEEILKEQLEKGQITEAQYNTMVDTSVLNARDAEMPPEIPIGVENPFANEDDFMDDSALKDIGSELTEEDKKYLLMKWSKWYKPWEWIELEKKYNEMTESFDIQDADSINTLILICKTDLKMNQALDTGDIEGYQRLSRVSSDLRKSAKFTAAQNKEQKNEFVDSVGELVAYCEKNGGAIPRYELNTPLDIVDKVIADLKGYTKDLIYEDKSLAKQIEDYLKKMEIAKQMKSDEKESEESGINVEIKDEDLIEYNDYLERQKNQDNLLIEESE